jgi:hypothetical protein
MSNRIEIENIQEAMTNRAFHTITMWNRLEGRPRKDDFDRALKAEIRDPLWMLTKQWQMGEFMGDDAGSPIGAKYQIATTRLNKYKPAGHPTQPFNNDIPLEGVVEQRPIPFVFEGNTFSLNIRLMMGRQWIKMLSKTIGDKREHFIGAGYSITAPATPDDKDEAFVLAHPETWQAFAAAENRSIDGYAIYKAIKDGVNIGAGDANETEINLMAPKFVAWVRRFFLQPEETEENAWLPERLEYQFACAAPENTDEKVYEAEEYYSGRLDWFNFSINDDTEELVVESNDVETDVQDTIAGSLIPATIDFGGMPNTRWWTFEEGKTYIGDIKPNTHEVGKLLFSEFVLLYANDWFLIPQTLEAGSISKINGLVVANVFGERIWVGPTGKGLDDDWQRWTMYTIDRKGKDLKHADHSLLLLPTVPKIQEGPPLEKFVMIRDEIANMVWAIETDISLPSGKRNQGAEAARELYAFYKRLIPEPPGTETSEGAIASIRYQIMNTVPENWIPFIPVHIDNNNREVQLQRAAMPRIIEGDSEKPQRVRPRTILLREGLDIDIRKAYYIHEEEIPRAGIQVSQAFQRTRWYEGKTYIWLGIHKKTGRGEGTSGLAFDQIIPIANAE